MGVGRGRIGALVLAASLVLAPSRGVDAQRGGGGRIGGGGGVIGAHFSNLGFRSPNIWGGNWGGSSSFNPGWGWGGGWGWGWPSYGVGVYTPYVGGWGWGFPFGGFGYGYGNPFFGMGWSPFDQWAFQQQQYALNVSRYNVQTAQAVNEYQQANLIQQQAVGQYLSNMQQYQAMLEKYSPKTGAQVLPGQDVPMTSLLPRNGMFTEDGQLLWPDIAPKNRYRDDVDRAVAAALKDAQANGGKASVALVSDARNRLQDYGQPALRLVRQQTVRAVGNRLRDFLNSLDYFLGTLAEPAPDDKAKQP